MARRPDDFDRDILDIIPERFEDDTDRTRSRGGSRFRTFLTFVVAIVVIGGIVAMGWKYLGPKKAIGPGIPVIKADDRPVKMRPDDPGGMRVPNQDKLVYERMDGEGEGRVERLLPAPEQPKAPPVAEAEEPAPVAPAPSVAAPLPKVPEPAVTPSAKAPRSEVAAAPAPALNAAVPPPARTPAPAPAAAAPAQKTVAPPPVAATPAAPPVVKKPAPSGDYLVQLGAVRSADAADKEWSRIQKTNSDLLSSLKPDVVKVDLGEKGTYWRVRAGPLSEHAARQICQELASRSQGCIVARK